MEVQESTGSIRVIGSAVDLNRPAWNGVRLHADKTAATDWRVSNGPVVVQGSTIQIA